MFETKYQMFSFIHPTNLEQHTKS